MCDDNYAQHACVMLTSLLANNQRHSQSFRTFILVPPSFSQSNKDKIIESLSPWTPKLEFLSIDERKVLRLKITGSMTLATYYKLLAPTMLPHDIKTVLCLDADIIINGSLLDLFNTDISDFSFAAVPDAAMDQYEPIRSKIHLDRRAHYFNAGVLLINLARWRSEKVGERALRFCMSNPDAITWWDQCALNHVMQGKFCVLDRKWNFQLHHMCQTEFSRAPVDWLGYEFHPSAVREASSATIIHFTSHFKPWSYLCTHPMKNLYSKYLKYTAWRDSREEDRTPRKIVKKYLRVNFPLMSTRIEAVYMLGKRVFTRSIAVRD